MASTGVTVADEVAKEFNEIKLGKLREGEDKVKFIVYKIVDGKIVKEKHSISTNFEDFLSELPKDDCRYAIYDMEFVTNDGRPGNKLVSIAWAPDSSKVKAKMLYAGSKDALNRVFVGVATKITATDLSELTEPILSDACKKFA